MAFPAVEFQKVTKSFGSIVANREVSFTVGKGTIHALVGENGAGKSTCMKLLYGMYSADSGEILVNGKAVHFGTPRDAMLQGIGMVHQHFLLAPTLSALDNILLMKPVSSGSRLIPQALRPLSRKRTLLELQALAKEFEWEIPWNQPVENLPLGIQQRIEILKLLYLRADILVLDEPTAVLTPHEVTEFFETLRKFRNEGKTILIVTHKLKEVLSLADEVTVLRDGESVASCSVEGLTEESLAALMVGRPVSLKASMGASAFPGRSLLCANIVSSKPKLGLPLKDVCIDVRAGEIIGIAGVEGNGQSELLRLLQHPKISFSESTTRGEIEILGKDARHYSVKQMRKMGIGFIPEDRHLQGLLLDKSLWENMLLGCEASRFHSRFGFLKQKELVSYTLQILEEFEVRPLDPFALAGSLSGGNQQKFICGRETAFRPKVLVASNPTRGVDIGAIEFIHEHLLRLRDTGTAILLLSADLDEVMMLSDRIHVMSRGSITASFLRNEADLAEIGFHMGGGIR